MNRSAMVAPSPLFRRLVLGTAFFLGLAAALVPPSTPVHAQEPKSPPPAAVPKPPPKSMTITDGQGAEIKIDVGEGPGPGGKSITAEASAAPSESASAGEDASGRRGKSKKRARVTIDNLDTDHEFDSFDAFVHDQPALAAMVVGIVTVVFFAPVLAIALILWYRMRKARMLNETMLKLAEKGIVPSADAIDALAGGKAPAAVAPYLEQAKQIRRRAAWSDLRKGVLMGGFGLALSAYSLLQDREANGLGLVLLFVGVGFVVLWWLEQRHLAPPAGVARDAGAGSVPTPENPPPT